MLKINLQYCITLLFLLKINVVLQFVTPCLWKSGKLQSWFSQNCKFWLEQQWYVTYSFQYKESSSIFSHFAHIFLMKPMANFTTEKYSIWKLLMKMYLVMVTIIKGVTTGCILPIGYSELNSNFTILKPEIFFNQIERIIWAYSFEKKATGFCSFQKHFLEKTIFE